MGNFDIGIFYRLGAPIMLFILGLLYVFATPKFKNSLGMRTLQSLRGKDEWKFGHKVIGAVFMLYGLITGGVSLLVTSAAIELNSLLVICVYGSLLLTTPFIMNFAIKKKFGIDEELERMKAERKQLQEEQYDAYTEEKKKKKAQRKKEADRKKRIKESDKKAKEVARKKKKGR